MRLATNDMIPAQRTSNKSVSKKAIFVTKQNSVLFGRRGHTQPVYHDTLNIFSLHAYVDARSARSATLPDASHRWPYVLGPAGQLLRYPEVQRSLRPKNQNVRGVATIERPLIKDTPARKGLLSFRIIKACRVTSRNT
jgi:hypothetical protein